MKNDDPILAELDSLKARVAALEAKTGLAKPATQSTRPVEPDGVRISYPIEPCKIAMPTEPEFRRLLSTVQRAFPILRPEQRFSTDEEAFFRDFRLSFERIAHLGRTDEINAKYSFGWWVDEACDWFRLRGNSIGSIRGGAFLCAIIAAGDIKFTEWDHAGNSWAFGLAGFGGKAASEAGWRRALNGELLKPSPGRFGPPPDAGSLRRGMAVG